MIFLINTQNFAWEAGCTSWLSDIISITINWYLKKFSKTFYADFDETVYL